MHYEFEPQKYVDSTTETWVTHGEAKKLGVKGIAKLMKEVLKESGKATKDACNNMLKEGMEQAKTEYADLFLRPFGLSTGILAQASIKEAKLKGDFIDMVYDQKSGRYIMK